MPHLDAPRSECVKHVTVSFPGCLELGDPGEGQFDRIHLLHLLRLTRGGHRGGPERGGADHAEGRPAVAQQWPDPRHPTRQVRRNGASRSCCEGIRGGFKVSAP